MKVEDLITELQKLNQEKEIFIYVSTMDSSYPIDDIEKSREYDGYDLCSWK